MLKLLLFLCFPLASVNCFEDIIPASKCTAKELKQFSQEYEVCHSKALQAVKADQLQILKKSQPFTDSESVCQALDQLIDECTLILGWCFSSQHVSDTISKQRQVSRAALASLGLICPDADQAVIQPPEDLFAEHYQYSSGNDLKFSLLLTLISILLAIKRNY